MDRLAQYKESIGRLLRGTEVDTADGSKVGWGSWSAGDRPRVRTDEEA